MTGYGMKSTMILIIGDGAAIVALGGVQVPYRARGATGVA